MIINKVIIGFVNQQFDTETRRFINQEFHGSDDRTWENEMGDSLNLTGDDAALVYGLGGVDEPYLNMEMVQPSIFNVQAGDRVLVTPKDGSDPVEEFQGVVFGIKDCKYIQVRDQDDNVFDCDPDQVHLIK